MSQTYKPKSLRRKRRHGFAKRSQTKDGRTVMQRRRRKGRKKITTV